jgi:hypothetical protein
MKERIFIRLQFANAKNIPVGIKIKKKQEEKKWRTSKKPVKVSRVYMVPFLSSLASDYNLLNIYLEKKLIAEGKGITYAVVVVLKRVDNDGCRQVGVARKIAQNVFRFILKNSWKYAWIHENPDSLSVSCCCLLPGKKERALRIKY